MPGEKRHNLAGTGKGLYYNQEEWLEKFLDDKGEFYNGTEAAEKRWFSVRKGVLKNFANFTGDSENDDESYK